MIVMELPKEVYGGNLIVFVVGILLGVLGYVMSGKVNNKKQGLIAKMTSVVMLMLTTLGLFGTMAFNVHSVKMEKENIVTYVEKTTRDLGDRLTKTTTAPEFNRVVQDLYQAEYYVVEKGFQNKQDVRTIGDVLLTGTGTEIGNYFTRLTEEDRGMVLATPADSLETFTVLEFANLESKIKRESLKLGSSGSMEVLENIDAQQQGLESKVSQLELPETSVEKTFKNTIVINVALSLLSLGIAVMLYTMVVDALKGLKGTGMYGDDSDTEGERSNQEESSEVEEYQLVDGEIMEVPVNESESSETDVGDTPEKPVQEDESYVESLLNKDAETIEKELDEKIGRVIKDKYKEPENKE